MNKKRIAFMAISAATLLLSSNCLFADNTVSQSTCSNLESQAQNNNFDFAGNLNTIQSCYDSCDTFVNNNASDDSNLQTIASCRYQFANFLYEANYQNNLANQGNSSSVSFNGPAFQSPLSTSAPTVSAPTTPTYQYTVPKVVVPNETNEINKETSRSSGIRWY